MLLVLSAYDKRADHGYYYKSCGKQIECNVVYLCARLRVVVIAVALNCACVVKPYKHGCGNKHEHERRAANACGKFCPCRLELIYKQYGRRGYNGNCAKYYQRNKYIGYKLFARKPVFFGIACTVTLYNREYKHCYAHCGGVEYGGCKGNFQRLYKARSVYKELHRVGCGRKRHKRKGEPEYYVLGHVCRVQRFACGVVVKFHSVAEVYAGGKYRNQRKYGGYCAKAVSGNFVVSADAFIYCCKHYCGGAQSNGGAYRCNYHNRVLFRKMPAHIHAEGGYNGIFIGHGQHDKTERRRVSHNSCHRIFNICRKRCALCAEHGNAANEYGCNYRYRKPQRHRLHAAQRKQRNVHKNLLLLPP